MTAGVPRMDGGMPTGSGRPHRQDGQRAVCMKPARPSAR